MSVFIARFSNNVMQKLRLHPSQFSDYLPFPSESHEYFEVDKGELIIFNYQVALERKPVKINDSYLLVQGAGARNLEDRVFGCFSNNLPLQVSKFPEPFCAIMLNSDGIKFSTSFCGVDPIFYIIVDDVLYVSNRHNLLERYISNRSFEKQSFIWIVGRNHISSCDTYWRNLKKVEPSYTYLFDGELSCFSKQQDFDLKYSKEDVISKINDFSYSLNESLAISPVKKRLWLSGGKDSRAILGLISKENLEKFDFVTHGETYSPDVMSSRDITNYLRLANQHTINPVGVGEGSIDIYKRLAVDLAWCFSGNSFADLKMFYNNKNLLVIGGHENGFKTKSNRLGLNEYLDSRKYWVDGFEILTKEAFSSQYSTYRTSLSEVLTNYPKSRFSQAESVHFRNSTYLASALSSCHLGTSEIHPFLDGRMFELLVGVDDEVLESQFIHYTMMSSHSRKLAEIPFANDRWPDKLKGFITATDYNYVTASKPYEFKSYFPSQKGFGLHGWRLQLVSLSRSFVLTYLKDNSSFFDFINFERLLELADKEISSFVLKDVYFWLSLLKVALVHYFDKRILFFSSVDSISKEIEGLFNESASDYFKGTSKDEIIKILKQRNKALEDCVATQEGIIRGYETASIGESLNLGGAKADIDSLSNLPDSELEIALLSSGFTELSGNLEVDHKLKIGKNRFVFNCELVSRVSEINKALFYIKARKGEVESKSLLWSDAGFYYKYVETGSFLNNINVEVELILSTADFSLGIMQWYSDLPIYVRNTIVKQSAD